MKVTVQKMKDAMMLYINNEFSSKFSDFRKWAIPLAGMGLVNAYVEPLLDKYGEFAISMGYMTEDGLIDVDATFDTLLSIAKEQGDIVQYIPMLGDVTFSFKDIQKLRSMM